MTDPRQCLLEYEVYINVLTERYGQKAWEMKWNEIKSYVRQTWVSIIIRSYQLAYRPSAFEWKKKR